MSLQISAGDRHTIFSTGINYFQSIPGLYINLRPVYQQFDGADNPMSRYLFYFSNHWLVGSNYTVDSGWLKSTDYSVRPEWKSGDWWMWSYDKSNYVAGLSLKCRGILHLINSHVVKGVEIYPRPYKVE